MTDGTASATRVREALRARRWSQADLSRASGVDKNTISDFLTGKRRPADFTLAKIEAALGLIPGTLAALGEDPERRADIHHVERSAEPP